MARKKKKNSNSLSKDLITVEAATKQIQSLLSHPDMQMWMFSGAARGLRSKILSVNFETLRNVAHSLPLINAIVNTRVDQVLPFCSLSTAKNDQGFKIKAKKDTKEDPAIVNGLCEFFEQTGFKYDPDREDDFMDFVQMFVRDTIIIDQVGTELQYNRAGEVIAFWAVDAAYIVRVDPEESDYGSNVRFAQVIDDKVYATYTNQNFIYDYKNKRSDLRFRGFGYSYIEMAIDVITTLLFGYRHLRDQFVKDKVPKGFISVMGDADSAQLDAIRRYWHAAMTGAGGEFNLPILPSGKEGVGLDFKQIGQSNKDMEYHKAMMFVSSIIGAVMSMDLAELGIKADDSTAIIGENTAPRLQFSKNRGLKSLLKFLEQHLNKILQKVNKDYVFEFVGIEPEDESLAAELDTKLVGSRKTINELRKEKGEPPLKEDYANVVLHPQAVQIYLADKQQQQQAEAQQQQADSQGSDEEEFNLDDEDFDEDSNSEDDDENGFYPSYDRYSSFQKSLPDSEVDRKNLFKQKSKVII